MKNILLNFFSTILVCFLVSCGGNAKKDLATTWQLSDYEIKGDQNDSVKNAMLLGSTIRFTEDGHYTSSGGIGADQGTYTLDEEGKTLSTISSAGKKSNVYTIDDLDTEKLVLSSGGTTITCTAITP